MIKDMDKIDRMILSELINNGRIPAKQLADKIGIHPNTLLLRLKRLEKKKIIKKYAAYVDFTKAGYDLHVIVLIEVRRGHPGDIEQMKDLLNIREIEALYATTGLYDLVAICRVRNRQNMLEVLQKIGDNKFVTKSVTQIVLFPYRAPHEFNPFQD